MKKVFPVITILILLSLLGIIFFQILWIKGALESQEQKFDEHVIMATNLASEDLMREKGNLVPLGKKSDIIFPSDKFQLEFFRPTIAKKYTKEEIGAIIRNAFNKQQLRKVPFEFAITSTSLIGDEVQSDNFIKFYQDSANNKNYVIPLEAPAGSISEGLSPQEMLIVVVSAKKVVWKSMTWPLIGATIFTIIIMCAFFLTIRTLLKQKKLSEIKSDFINNMTHEFKTPLATISLAVDALKNEKVMQDKVKSDYFTGIIKEENKRMNKQVETILQAALLDKNEVQLNTKKLHAHQFIKSALNNISLQIQEKGGTIETHLDAEKDTIMADEVHFTNLVSNLLDNAIKYSKENLHIKLSTQNASNHFRIKIEDNGIGMSKETLTRIFEKFYRAHTGNVHNVKGFGLGLTYVKTMVDAHKGTIKADSVVGKGSTFIISLPLAK